METLKKLVYFSIVTSFALFASCDGEDGMDGLNGEQGMQGIQGEPGQNGTDGNANVMSAVVDPFPSWTSGSFLGQEANFVEISEALLTEEVLDNTLVLVYFQLGASNIWYPMTYAFPFDNGNDEVLIYTYEPEQITIYSLSSTGPLNASISKINYFMIPANATAESATSREIVLRTLNNAGVDINNYSEVAEYFNQQ